METSARAAIAGGQVDLRKVVHAATGTVVEVRDASIQDLDGLREMFSRSTRETIYERFHLPYRRVPEWILAHLLDPEKHRGHALVAVAGGMVIGHAMYGRPDAGEAEIAVMVEDGWQSRGVGKLLLSELSEAARRRSVEVFVCYSLVENRKVQEFVGSVFVGARVATG